MELIAAWKESLSLLRWQNFKLFLLVTLNSLARTYRLLFTYWWWLIGLLILSPVIMFLGPNIFVRGIFFAVFIACCFAFQIVLYLSCRPSVLPKDANYFMGYKNRLALLVGICVISAIGQISGRIPLSTVFCTLWALFALDQKQGADSLLLPISRAAKMLFYNLPLYVALSILIPIPAVIIGLFLVPFIGIPAILSLAHITDGSLILAKKSLGEAMGMALFIYSAVFIFAPIEIVTIVNLYTKKLHDQSDLYFPQP